MDNGSEQLTDMAVSEISRASRKIMHDIDNNNADSDAMAKDAMKEMVHLTKSAIRVGEMASRAISNHWGGDFERSHECNVDF